MMETLRAENIFHAYGKEEILRGVSFSLAAGEFISVLGSNGSGKTTLLKILAGLLAPTGGGRVKIMGRDMSEYGRAGLAKIAAYVSSDEHVPYDFPVLDIVVMGRSPYLKWWQAYGAGDRETAFEILRKMKIEHLASRGINSLSSGEKQLVFVSQALAQKPGILILDEPTSHLDVKYKAEIFETVKRIKEEEKISVLSSTHDLGLAKHYSDGALLLKKGREALCLRGKDAFSAEKLGEIFDVAENLVFS